MAEKTGTLHLKVQASKHEPLEHEFVVNLRAPLPVLELKVQPAPMDRVPTPTLMERRLPTGSSGPGLLSAWVGLSEREGNNTAICRGVPVTSGGHAVLLACVAEDGSFRMPEARVGPLCLQRPEQPPLWFLSAKDGSETYSPLPTGSIAGHVKGLPVGPIPPVWIVLFNRGLLRRTARVAGDGTFRFDAVPVGQFWLRVGDDDFDRVHSRLGKALGLDDHQVLAKPWVGATEVTVRPDEATDGVVVPFD